MEVDKIPDYINLAAQIVGYAAMLAAVIPHPHARTAGVVLKVLRAALDYAGANVHQAESKKRVPVRDKKGDLL